MVFREYRGKSRDGHWAYGSLLFVDGFYTIYDNSKNTINVVLDTVGQWSGVYDINDIKVYEGDIIRDGKYLYLVEFDAPYFCAKEIGKNISHLLSLKENMQVVGNIYEDRWMLDLDNDKLKS